MSPILVKRGIDKAVTQVVKEIKKQSRIVNGTQDIQHIATISANNDEEIGSIIADAIEKVGKDGVITVEESKSLETSVKIVEGMEFDRGYISAYFANNLETRTTEFNNPYVLITDKKISAMNELLSILEKVAHTEKPLLIICEDMDGEALATLVLNSIRGTLRTVVVKAPGFGDRRKELLQDIAVLTGGTVITADLGLSLKDATLESLGKCGSIKVDKDTTTIVDGSGNKDKLEKRVKEIRSQIAETSAPYDKEQLQKRLAKLSGGVAIIEIGAVTEPELKEKKYRIEDTLAATRAALEEGIVVGGGQVLIEAAKALHKIITDLPETSTDEKAGYRIVERALEEPIRQIANNAGLDGAVIADKAKTVEKGWGFNALTQKWENLFDAGVIDPAKVARSAVQNAASVAGLLLTTECAIAEIPAEK